MINTNLYFNLADFEKPAAAPNDVSDKEKTSEDFAAFLNLPATQTTNTAPTDIAAPEQIVQEKTAFGLVQNVQANQTDFCPIFISTNKKQSIGFAPPTEQISKNIKMEAENITAKTPMPFSPEQIFKTKSERTLEFTQIVPNENVEREEVTIPIFQNPKDVETAPESQIPVENFKKKFAVENQFLAANIETKFAPKYQGSYENGETNNVAENQNLFVKAETKFADENQVLGEMSEIKFAPISFEKAELNIAPLDGELSGINIEKSDVENPYAQEFENFLTTVSTGFINTEIEPTNIQTKQIIAPNFSIPAETKNDKSFQILSVEGFSKAESKSPKNIFGNFETANYVETNYRLDFTNSATKPEKVEPMILIENEPTKSDLPLETPVEANTTFEPKTAFEVKNSFEPKTLSEYKTAVEFKDAFGYKKPLAAESSFVAKATIDSKLSFKNKTPNELKTSFEIEASFGTEIAENKSPLFERANDFFETADFSNSKPQNNKFDGFVKIFPEINLTGKSQNFDTAKLEIKDVPAQIFNQTEIETSEIITNSDAAQKTDFNSIVVAEAPISEPLKTVEPKSKAELKNEFTATTLDVKAIEEKPSMTSGQQNGFANAEKDFSPLEKTLNERKSKAETNSAEQIFDNFLKSEIKTVSSGEINSPSLGDLKHSIFAQIEPRVLELVKEGISPIEKKILRIKLNPEELGAVEITLHKNESGVISAHFKTESDASSQVIKESLDQLRSSLENAGIKVGELNISSGSSSNNGASRENQPQQFDAMSRNFGSVSNSDGNFTNKQEDDPNRLVNLRA